VGQTNFKLERKKIGKKWVKGIRKLIPKSKRGTGLISIDIYSGSKDTSLRKLFRINFLLEAENLEMREKEGKYCAVLFNFSKLFV